MLHQHLSAEPRRPSTVPDPLWTVIERCLRKNPRERPSAVNLARALRIVAEGVGVHANSMQIAAADGVGHILAPDPAPAQVPGAAPDPFGSADATQVLPHGAGSYDRNDPNAATSVLPHTSGPAGAADPTAVLPHTGGSDPTSVMPPVPSHDPGGQPPSSRTPGRTSSARPATATSRPRSSTSTPARTRCAAALSGRPTASSSPRSSSPSSPSDPRSRRRAASSAGLRAAPAPGTATRSSNSRTRPRRSRSVNSRSGTRPRRSPSSPLRGPSVSPGRRVSRVGAAPTRCGSRASAASRAASS